MMTHGKNYLRQTFSTRTALPEALCIYCMFSRKDEDHEWQMLAIQWHREVRHQYSEKIHKFKIHTAWHILMTDSSK